MVSGQVIILAETKNIFNHGFNKTFEHLKKKVNEYLSVYNTNIVPDDFFNKIDSFITRFGCTDNEYRKSIVLEIKKYIFPKTLFKNKKEPLI